MSTLEKIVEELRTLPEHSLVAAASYVHQLKVTSAEKRRGALERAFGSLSASEADDLDRAIQTHCERIDAGQW